MLDNLLDAEWLFFLSWRNIQTPQVPPQGAAGWQAPRTWEHNSHSEFINSFGSQSNL